MDTRKTALDVLVCGGRTLDPIKVADWLTGYGRAMISAHFGRPLTIGKIINGQAKGADAGSSVFAAKYGLTLKTYPAKWNVYGLNAGRRRNVEMIVDSKPDVVIAFPGKKGTEHMITTAMERGVPVIKVDGDFNIDTTQPYQQPKGI
jgi:ABC-type Fe3+-hydroxamate transport system substrate-binding protein